MAAKNSVCHEGGCCKQKCTCIHGSMGLALARLMGKQFTATGVPLYGQLFEGLVDMLQKFSKLVEEKFGKKYLGLQRLIELSVVNLQKALARKDIASMPYAFRPSSGGIDKTSGLPRLLVPSTELPTYRHPQESRVMTVNSVENILDDMMNMLRAFSALPIELLGRNIACVVNAVYRAQMALLALTSFGKLSSEDPDSMWREMLLKSGLLTASEMRLLIAGGELTDEMIRKLLNSNLLTEEQRRALMTKLLLRTGMLTDSLRKLLESSAVLTDEMLKKLMESGALSDEQMRKLKKLSGSSSLSKEGSISKSERELRNHSLSKASSKGKRVSELSKITEEQSEKLLKSEMLAESEKEVAEGRKSLEKSSDSLSKNKTKPEEIAEESEELAKLKKQDKSAKQKDSDNGEGNGTGKAEKRESKEKRNSDKEKLEGQKSGRTEKQTAKQKKSPPDIPCSLIYQLSNPLFIEQGWTNLPTENIMYEKNLYGASLVKTNIPLFGYHTPSTYQNGVNFAERLKDGMEIIRYPDGNIAVEYTNNSKTKIGRFTIYGNGPAGKTVLGIFDSLGNGLVYDCCGKIRMSYCQSGGTLYEASSGCRPHHEMKWNWMSSLRPRGFTVYKDTNLPVMFKAPVGKAFVAKGEKSNLKSAKSGKSSAKSSKSSKKSKKSGGSKNSDGRSSKATDVGSKKMDDTLKVDKKALSLIEEHTITRPVPEPILKLHDVLTPLKPFTLRINPLISLHVTNQQDVQLRMNAENLELRLELGIVIDHTNVLKKELVDSKTITPGAVPLTEAVLPKSASITKICTILEDNKAVIKKECKRQKRVRGIPAPIIPEFRVIRT